MRLWRGAWRRFGASEHLYDQLTVSDGGSAGAKDICPAPTLTGILGKLLLKVFAAGSILSGRVSVIFLGTEHSSVLSRLRAKVNGFVVA
jgi:hypothetical protein